MTPRPDYRWGGAPQPRRATASTSIRRPGWERVVAALTPGKFEACDDPVLAERLWNITLDGGHESEIGDVDEGGWYALVGDSETPGFYIIRCDSDGFVTIEHGPVEMHTADRLWTSYEDEQGGVA